MVHLAIVEELVALEHTISLLPRAHILALFVEEAVAVWVSDAEGTETDIVGRAREVHRLLWINYNEHNYYK